MFVFCVKACQQHSLCFHDFYNFYKSIRTKNKRCNKAPAIEDAGDGDDAPDPDKLDIAKHVPLKAKMEKLSDDVKLTRDFLYACGTNLLKNEFSRF